MRIVTPEKRLQYTATGWPKPTDSERCAAVTLRGLRCAKRRGISDPYCQQHQKRPSKRRKGD